MYSKRKIALLDCNNFYVSCERLFRPDLKNKPVAVLSNNDGCIIARSNEVKKIGITWEYVHNVRQKLQQNNVTLFSSNYNLYGDISDRIMTIIKSHFKNIEIYSIDEAFFDCTELDESEVIDKLLALRKQILKWTGVPVSIGVGPNKTIAKLMNHIAKKRQKYNGVCYFENLKNKERYVEINIEKVWGVGKQTVLKLQKLNIKTIQQFLQLSESQVKYIFTITGLRTYLELKQQYILLLNKNVKNKKEIMTSRTFGKEVTSIDELQTALHHFLNKGCIKLKRQNLLVKKVVIFFETNPYKPYYVRYKQQQTLEFATNDNKIIWTQLQYLIHLIFNPKRNYKKAGILLYDLTTTVQ
ncbi:MAG: Y-family DNA polymerase, partial [Candidatus Heimdallarchaeota archaeon]